MIKYLLIFSTLLHIAILSIKIPDPQHNKDKQKQKSPIVKVKLQQQEDQQQNKGSKDEDLYVIKDILEQLEKIEKLAKEEAAIQSMMEKCETFYMGIGVVHSSLFGEISEVVPGSPADRAGIKVGDIPLDALNIRDKYPEGTNITIPILRNGIMYEIPVTIGKICTKEKRNEDKKP